MVHLWLAFSVVGSTFVSFGFVVNTIGYLEGSSEGFQSALSVVLMYLPAFVIFTLAMRHRISYDGKRANCM